MSWLLLLHPFPACCAACVALALTCTTVKQSMDPLDLMQGLLLLELGLASSDDLDCVVEAREMVPVLLAASL
jgi:hypothetical protein